jgi:hypothetical protein
MKKILVILFLSWLAMLRAGEKQVVHYDTSSAVQVQKASEAKEKEVFSDKEFQYKEDVKETKNWFSAFIDWIMEKIFGKMDIETTERTWNIIKWSLIVLFIAGITFILYKSKFRGLLRGDAKRLSGASFSDLPEDIESVNLDKLIEEALAKGNYRMAIRWCFLKVLQNLNQNEQITWQPSKTNVDYEFELQNASLRQNFSRLSHVFEYVWYGEMKSGEKLFTNYRSETEKFNSSLHA